MTPLAMLNETMGSEPSRMLFRALPVMMRYVYAQAVMSFVLYADDEPQRRTERFLKTLEAVGRSSDKPYEITASIGWASAPYSENVVSELLNTADERMYENKLMRKKKRI
jgi:GGDEF domain-containing protein